MLFQCIFMFYWRKSIYAVSQESLRIFSEICSKRDKKCPKIKRPKFKRPKILASNVK